MIEKVTERATTTVLDEVPVSSAMFLIWSEIDSTIALLSGHTLSIRFELSVEDWLSSAVVEHFKHFDWRPRL